MIIKKILRYEQKTGLSSLPVKFMQIEMFL